MTITDRNAPPPPKKKAQLPTWAAIAALVACFLLASGVIWWFVYGSSAKHTIVKIDPSKAQPDTSQIARSMRPTRRVDRSQSGVLKMRDGDWLVRSDNGAARVSSRNNDYIFAYFYPTGLGLRPDQSALVAGRFRILRDDAMAKEWNVTPEQIEKIKKVDVNVGTMNLPATDQTTVKNLWNDYMKASDGTAKTDAEKKLVAGLEDAAKKSLDPTKAAIDVRLKELQAILTPEQITKITKG